MEKEELKKTLNDCHHNLFLAIQEMKISRNCLYHLALQDLYDIINIYIEKINSLSNALEESINDDEVFDQTFKLVLEVEKNL